MRKFILFLIRLKLGLKVNEPFRFANQASKRNYYYFTEDKLMKCWKDLDSGHTESKVSVNWILDPECKIEKVRA